MADKILDIENFDKGLEVKKDDSKSSFGSARVFENCQITPRGGIAVRSGSQRIGGATTVESENRGFHNFNRSHKRDEILMRAIGEEILILSSIFEDQGWQTLKSGLENEKEWGFATSLVNNWDTDIVVGTSRYNDMFYWTGDIFKIIDPLPVSPADAIQIDSVLEDEILEEVTFNSTASDELIFNNITFAEGQWNNLWIYIPSQNKVWEIKETNLKSLVLYTEGSSTIPVLTDEPVQIRRLKLNNYAYFQNTDGDLSIVASNKIIDKLGTFSSKGFKKGMEINISGSSGSNNGNFVIKSIKNQADINASVWTQDLKFEVGEHTIYEVGTRVYINITGVNTATEPPNDAANWQPVILEIELDTDVDLVNDIADTAILVKSVTNFIINGVDIALDSTVQFFDKLVITPSAERNNMSADDLLLSAVTDVKSGYRGNRITNYLTRLVVGNVRSGKAKNQGGVDSGYAAGGSAFVSTLQDPINFDFEVPRIPGQGDIIPSPYGGGDITDVNIQENNFYIFKRDYIEADSYTQDGNDFPVREQLKANFGSIGKTLKGSDDIYFFTPDNKISSIGRVSQKDIKPQSLNIGDKIERFLNKVDATDIGRGIEHKDRLFFPIKSSENEDFNDILLIYSKQLKAFEGIWEFPAFGLVVWNNRLVFAESNGNNVREIINDKTDIIEDIRFSIPAVYQTNFFNLTSSKSSIQKMYGLYIEGYITDGAEITFNIFKDFSTTPFIKTVCAFDGEKFKDGINVSSFLGKQPMGTNPISAVSLSDVNEDGFRHFSLRFYFPFEYGNYFSVGHESTMADFPYEIIRYGLIIAESPVVNQNRIKNI